MPATLETFEAALARTLVLLDPQHALGQRVLDHALGLFPATSGEGRLRNVRRQANLRKSHRQAVVEQGRNPDHADTQQQVEALPRQALGFPQRRDHALAQAVGDGKGRAIAAKHKRHVDASVHVDDRGDAGHADGVDLLVGARFDRLRRPDHIGDDDPPVTRNLYVPVGLDSLGKGLERRKIVVEIDRRHERVDRIAAALLTSPVRDARGWGIFRA